MTPELPPSAEERQAVIRKEYAELDRYVEGRSKAAWDAEWARVDGRRSKCPFCGSADLSYDFKNVNGKLEGCVSGSWGIFGGGMSGGVRGSVGTDKVFYCGTCKNAWKDKEPEYTSYGDALQSLLHPMYLYFDDLERAEEDVTWERGDPAETFPSRAAKVEARRAEVKWLRFDKPSALRNFHADTIRWLVRNHGYRLEYKFYRNIADWPDARFAEWGCKTFPAPPRRRIMHRLFATLVRLFSPANDAKPH